MSLKEASLAEWVRQACEPPDAESHLEEPPHERRSLEGSGYLGTPDGYGGFAWRNKAAGLLWVKGRRLHARQTDLRQQYVVLGSPNIHHTKLCTP